MRTEYDIPPETLPTLSEEIEDDIEIAWWRVGLGVLLAIALALLVWRH